MNLVEAREPRREFVLFFSTIRRRLRLGHHRSGNHNCGGQNNGYCSHTAEGVASCVEKTSLKLLNVIVLPSSGLLRELYIALPYGFAEPERRPYSFQKYH